MKSIHRAGATLLIGFMVVKLGGFVFKLICMRFLPVELYGQLAVFLVLFNWLALFGTLNMSIGLAKFASSSGEGKSYYSASVIGVTLISLGISAVLIALAGPLSSALNVSGSVMLWLALCTPLSAVYNVGIFYMRGSGRMRRSSMTDVVLMTSKIALLSGLIALGISDSPFLAYVLGFVAIDIIILGTETVKTSGIGFRKHLLPVLLYSLPIFAGEFLRLFSMSIDRVIISGAVSASAAGIYDVGVSMCIGYLIIANSYSNALLPLASRDQHDVRTRKSHLRKAFKASCLLFAGYTLLLLAAAGPFIGLINEAYLPVTGFIAWLAAAHIFVGFFIIMSFYANSVSLQKHVMLGSAVFAFLNLALNLYLIPVMLYEGASLALLVSSAVSTAVLGALIWKAERY